MLYSQNLTVHYKYEVRNAMSNRLFEFPAVLQIGAKNSKLYKVQYGIADQIKNNDENSKGSLLIDKGSYGYTLYSTNVNNYMIEDEINGKKFLFNDEVVPLTYVMKDEAKLSGNIKLKKAETEFRGRKYIIWYDPSAKVKGGPWKFSNLPGLAYEICDEENLFRWQLLNIENRPEKLENPFINKETADVLPFTEYPKLKYTTKVFMQNDTEKKGTYREFQQKRDGLEKTFEWER